MYYYVCYYTVYRFSIIFFLIVHRDLDRERAKLEGQEKKIIADIKKMAKQGQMVCLQYIDIIFYFGWNIGVGFSSKEPYLIG